MFLYNHSVTEIMLLWETVCSCEHADVYTRAYIVFHGGECGIRISRMHIVTRVMYSKLMNDIK